MSEPIWTNQDAHTAIEAVIDNHPDEHTLTYDDVNEARQALRYLFRLAELQDPDEPHEFIVMLLDNEDEPDLNGERVLITCGWPGCTDHELIELDRAERENDTEITDLDIVVSQGDPEFHTVAYMCGSRHANEIDFAVGRHELLIAWT